MSDGKDFWGLEIYLVDKVSGEVVKVTRALDSLEMTANRVSNSVGKQSSQVGKLSDAYLQLFAVMQAAQSMQVVAQWMQDFGAGIVKSMFNFGKSVATVGGEFSQYMVQLVNVFHGNRVKAEGELSSIIDLAKRTTADVKDVVSGSVMLNLRGVNPFAKYGESTKQEMITWAADLAASMPGKTIEDSIWAIGEAVSGQWRSIKNRFNFGSQDFLKVTGKEMKESLQGNEAIEAIVKYMETKGFAGLQENMAKTLPAVIQNIEDAWSIMLYRMSDMGIYKAIVKSFTDIYKAVLKITEEEETLTRISDVLTMLWKPVDMLLKGALKLVDAISLVAKENPQLLKMASIITVVAGISIFSLGKVLGIAAGLLQTLASLGIVVVYFFDMMKEKGTSATTMLHILNKGLKGFGLSMLKLSLVSLVIYGAWKRDFMGIRTFTQNWIKDTKVAIGEVDKFMQMPTNTLEELGDMMLWAQKNTDTLAGSFARLAVILLGAFDIFTEGSISDDLFKKSLALGVDDTLAELFELKNNLKEFARGFYDLLEGIGEGVGTIGKPILKVIKVVSKLFGKLFSLVGIKPSDIDPSGPYALGAVLGTLVGGFFLANFVNKVKPIAKFVYGIFKKKKENKALLNLLGDFDITVPKAVSRLSKLKKAFGTVFSFVRANPITLILAGIAVLILLIYNNWDKIYPVVKKVWNTVTNNKQVKNALSEVKEFLNDIVWLWNTIFDAIGKAIDRVVEFNSMSRTGGSDTKNTDVFGVQPAKVDKLATGGKIVSTGVAIVDRDERVLNVQQTKEYETENAVPARRGGGGTRIAVDSSINNPQVNIHVPQGSTPNPTKLAKDTLREIRKLKREDDMRDYLPITV